jgi:hypothetical protein
MPPKRWLLALLLAALPIMACTQGDECDTCSADEDCRSGFVCSSFDDGSKRCGSGLGATTCRVR